jgi:tRNA (guanosine-2'-O-)-methyltransferase
MAALGMRRRTPGVVSREELVEARLRRAESEDPARMIRLLEPFVADRRKSRLKEVIDRRLQSVTVMFDAPYDPHNGAAVIRSCEAFGIQRLHVVERGKVHFLVAAPVARGCQKWLDVFTYKAPSDAVAAVEGFELVAAHPEGELDPEELATIPRLALLIGNERDGIREEMMAACKRRVKVPMRGFVESLNVSVTAAILLHAATHGRQGDLDEADRTRLYARGLYFSVPRAEDVLAAEV